MKKLCLPCNILLCSDSFMRYLKNFLIFYFEPPCIFNSREKYLISMKSSVKRLKDWIFNQLLHRITRKWRNLSKIYANKCEMRVFVDALEKVRVQFARMFVERWFANNSALFEATIFFFINELLNIKFFAQLLICIRYSSYF